MFQKIIGTFYLLSGVMAVFYEEVKWSKKLEFCRRYSQIICLCFQGRKTVGSNDFHAYIIEDGVLKFRW
ncbi:hypothetical protein [Chryseobacterium candidae]|uniref:Uncharacterized protein n=1 Tax=Chryseobacterium candidae TaxID=1978493 RepID=A0ABY2R832_9FLAO|nr:hypothetical protein [Chryseobacterium candidae]THV60731.1 hypothetical protein EK417_09090 [Chryseobacterium candidae]